MDTFQKYPHYNFITYQGNNILVGVLFFTMANSFLIKRLQKIIKEKNYLIDQFDMERLEKIFSSRRLYCIIQLFEHRFVEGKYIFRDNNIKKTIWNKYQEQDNARTLRWRQEHPNAHRDYFKTYRQMKSLWLTAYSKSWYEQNKERILEENKKKYLENREVILAKQKEREQIKKQSPEYVIKQRAYSLSWYHKNKRLKNGRTRSEKTVNDVENNIASSSAESNYQSSGI